MTQPAAPAPASNGQVIAAAAIALALIAVEQQLRQAVQQDLETAFDAIAAAALITAAAAPGTVLTGLALLSLPAFHNTLTSALDKARHDIADTVETAYVTGAQIAKTKVAADLADLGYTVPTGLPELPDTTGSILRDVDAMLGYAQTDLQNNIRLAFDGISGDDPTAARLIAIRQAIENARLRYTQRTQAAATTALYRGSTDAQEAIFSEYQNTTGHAGLLKRWRTTSTDPCGMCKALNGTTVGINAEFDHQATTNAKDYRRVWRNLSGPPRHPNCRCQLELVTP